MEERLRKHSLGPYFDPQIYQPDRDMYPLGYISQHEYSNKTTRGIFLATRYLQTQRVKSILKQNPELADSINIHNDEKTNLIDTLLIDFPYPYQYNLDHVIDIANIILRCSKNPMALITTKIMIRIIKKHMFELFRVIKKYLQVDKTNTCLYCGITEPKEILCQLCMCKDMIHFSCFEVIHEKNRRDLDRIPCVQCGVLFNNKLNEIRTVDGSFDNRVFYPHDDLYFKDEKYPTRVYGFDRLIHAVIYLQTERVSKLLEDKSILLEINKSCDYFGSTLVILLSKEQSLYKKRFNKKHYIDVVYLLINKGKIDIDVEDYFGNTAIYYAYHSKFNEMICILNGSYSNPVNTIINPVAKSRSKHRDPFLLSKLKQKQNHLKEQRKSSSQMKPSHIMKQVIKTTQIIEPSQIIQTPESIKTSSYVQKSEGIKTNQIMELSQIIQTRESIKTNQIMELSQIIQRMEDIKPTQNMECITIQMKKKLDNWIITKIDY